MKPRKLKSYTCECSDPGCVVHKGESCSFITAQRNKLKTLRRVDMEDTTGTLMCSPCADDAMASGLFS